MPAAGSTGAQGEGISAPRHHWYTYPARSFYNNYYRVWKDRDALRRSYLRNAPGTFGASPSERLSADLRGKSLAQRVFYNMVVNPRHRDGGAGIGLGGYGGQGKRDQFLGSLSTAVSTLPAMPAAAGRALFAMKSAPKLAKGVGVAAAASSYKSRADRLGIPWYAPFRTAVPVAKGLARNLPGPDNRVAALVGHEAAFSAVDAATSMHPANGVAGRVGNFAAFPAKMLANNIASLAHGRQRAADLRAVAGLSPEERSRQSRELASSMEGALRDAFGSKAFLGSLAGYSGSVARTAGAAARNPALRERAMDAAVRLLASQSRAMAKRRIRAALRSAVSGTRHETREP